MKRDPEAIAAGIRQIAAMAGVPVSELSIDRWREFPYEIRSAGHDAVYRAFGSWDAARAHAAGLPPPPPIPREQRNTPNERPRRDTTPAPPPIHSTGERLLVIPDAHAHPEYDNARFDDLARLIHHVQPEHILQCGDLWDMASLCKHSSTWDIEGARVQADLDAGWDANHRLAEGWRGYDPNRVFTSGNHEDPRLASLVSGSPHLEGFVFGVRELHEGLEAFGWNVFPFKETVDVCGYACSHFLPSGVMGRPVGGVNQGRSLQTHGHVSTIVGHSHVRGEYLSTDYLGDRVQSINAGYFGHEDMVEGWNRNTHQMWWRGVALVTLQSTARGRGYGDIEWISASEIRRRF